MKFKQLQSLSAEDLEKKKSEATLELMKLRSQVATGTNPKNPHMIKNFKKILSRIKKIEQEQTKTKNG